MGNANFKCRSLTRKHDAETKIMVILAVKTKMK